MAYHMQMIDSSLLVIRILLAIVFSVAGLTKLSDRAGTRQNMQDFGVPALLASPIAFFLPIAELTVAASLIPLASAWWGGLGALVFMTLFALVIGINIALGRKPDCRCFGQLAAKPIGWSTLSRNLILAGLAGFIVYSGRANAGMSAVGWLLTTTLAERIALINGMVAIGLGASTLWLLFQVLGQQGRILLRLEGLDTQSAGATLSSIDLTSSNPRTPRVGLPLGSGAPDFQLPGLFGEASTLGKLRETGEPVLLIFADPDCGPCTALLPDIRTWQTELTDLITIAVISQGTVEANREKSQEYGVINVLLQQGTEVSSAYRAYGTPTAVLVRSDGTVGSFVAQGAEEIRALLAHATVPGSLRALEPGPPADANGHLDHAGTAQAPAMAPAPAVGDLAPTIRLSNLDGRQVDLAELRGSPTLVLFWNPGCGFCQRMLPDLKAWEASPPPGAPQMLVVSTGSVDANRAMGLRSPVVLDSAFAAGYAYGAQGTPSAILIDGEGRIASTMEVGAPAALALAMNRKAQENIEFVSGALPN